MRILAFSPYAAWQFHTNYETTLMRACQVRGAEVKVLLCDAVFNECDMYNPPDNRQSRPALACKECQFNAKRILDASGLPYQWLGEYLSEAEKQEAFEWAQSLHRHDFQSAVFRGFPVGEWVTGSVVSGFRTYPIQIDDWVTIHVFRGFLHAAAVACIALKHILEQWKPDALVLFNGRMSVTRVAFNLARGHGVRVLVHERPMRPGTLFVLENEICTSTIPFENLWSKWKEVPLTRPQLDTVIKWLHMRRYGLSWGEFRFAASPLGDEKGRALSGVQTGRPLIVLFTTSTDEFAGDPTMQTPFTSQEEWMGKVIDWVAHHPQYDFVIRAHPSLAGKAGTLRANYQIQWLEKLQKSLPRNARLVPPDSTVSSYDLMDNADWGLTYGSTAGLEMMAIGKPIALVPGFALYEPVPGIVLFNDPEQVDAVMDHLVTLKPSREYKRDAFRWIYRYFYHMQLPFSLVTVKHLFESELRYTSNEALKPGADETIDRVSAFLLENKPIYEDPKAVAVTSTEEDRFLDTLDNSLNWINNPQLRLKARGYENLRKIRRSLKKVDRVRNFVRRVTQFIATPESN